MYENGKEHGESSEVTPSGSAAASFYWEEISDLSCMCGYNIDYSAGNPSIVNEWKQALQLNLADKF